jgi:TonB family protein
MSSLMKKFNWRHIRISFFSAVVASLILHLILGLEIYLTHPKQPEFEKIELQIVETPTDKQTTEDKKSQEHEVAKQVVDQSDKAINDEIDAKAKFLSQHNQKVEKQTVAKNHGEFKNRPNQVTSPSLPSQAPSKIDLKNFTPKFDVKKAVEAREEKEKEYDRNAEILTQKKLEQQHILQNKVVVRPGSMGGEASQTLDYLKDTEVGLETLLSTREFVYYSYYARIRRQLNQYWGPKVREKLINMSRQGRQIASTEDKITKCLIILDKRGNLAKVQIIGNSGIRELDDAAIEAFKSAAPFPNPPNGIEEPDGSIKIRWDFVLEI